MRLATLLLMGGMLGLVSLGGAASAEETPRYQAWSGAQTSPEVKKFIDDLNALIDEGDKAQAADPQFIEDLRALVNGFQNPWTTRLLEDSFQDGQYTSNPVWTVSAGQWRVDPKGAAIGLTSKVPVPGTQSTGQSLTNSLIGALLQQPAAATYASIFTPVKISNAFAIRMEVYSKDKGGRLDLGPYQGTAGNIAYRLAYLSGTPTPLQLLKVTSAGTAVIGSYKSALNLEDGAMHVIEWTRDRAGAMNVAVDGKVVITASDRGIRDPFDGFLMVNSGGAYWLRSVAIDGSKP